MIVRMVHATRPGSRDFYRSMEGAVLAGASPRASIWLYRLSKFKAFMEGKNFVTPDHLISVIPEVMGHRILLTYEASIDKMTGRSVALEIAKSVV